MMKHIYGPDPLLDYEKHKLVNDYKMNDNCDTARGNITSVEENTSALGNQAEIPSSHDQVTKESMLSALGLQSLRTVQTNFDGGSANSDWAKHDTYTGTLKTIIKLQRSSDKRPRNPLKLILKQERTRGCGTNEHLAEQEDDSMESEDFGESEKIHYTICNEPGTSLGDNEDVFHFRNENRKCLEPSCSYRSCFDITSTPQFLTEKDNSTDMSVLEPKDDNSPSAKSIPTLVIPEKSSSFSIHPGRLCSDVCSYCFGKFGSLDTPCHIAQLKSHERQKKILEFETHLTGDSCLCDACFRHVDRKAKHPSYNSSPKKHISTFSRLKSRCSVQRCSQPANHHVGRKWLIKLKKNIAGKVPINMDEMPQHLPFPLCAQHYSHVDSFMVCGICKRRLTRTNMFPMGTEVYQLNNALHEDEIPVRLSENQFLCKLCRYFGTLRLKHKDTSLITGNQKIFFNSYRKRLLHCHNIEVSDSEDEDEERTRPLFRKVKRRKSKPGTSKDEDECHVHHQTKGHQIADVTDHNYVDLNNTSALQFCKVKKSKSLSNYRLDSTATINAENTTQSPKTSISIKNTTIKQTKPTKMRLKLNNLSLKDIENINMTGKFQQTSRSLLSNQESVVIDSPSEDEKQCYPGKDQVALHAEIQFPENLEGSGENIKTSDWEKCSAYIQYSKNIKELFQQLHRPYGNHSSFFRHLVLLEQYWRSGDLMLSPNASSKATNYLNSIHNRISAYDSRATPSHASFVPPSVTLPPSAPAIPTLNVPVIDLPLRNSFRCGIMTSERGSLQPVATARMHPKMKKNTQPKTKSISTSCSPFATSYVNTPSLITKHIKLDATPTSMSSHLLNKILPIVKVSASGKVYPIVKGLTHMKKLKALQHEMNRPSTPNVPLICDVRSLASGSGGGISSKEKNSPHLSKPKISLSVVPQSSVSNIATLRPGLKPSTVVTPTGIILSRQPEISVCARHILEETP